MLINIYKGPNFISSEKLDVETYIKPTNYKPKYMLSHSTLWE